MRCPACKKYVHSALDSCPYCGAAIAHNKQKNRIHSTRMPIYFSSDISVGKKLSIASGLSMVCFLLWRLIVAQVICRMMGNDRMEVFNAVVSVARIRIIWLVSLGALSYLIYEFLSRKKQKPLIFLVIVVALCTTGVSWIQSEGFSAVNEHLSPSAMALFSLIAYVYGIGMPLMQGAVYLALDEDDRTRAVWHTVVAVEIFLAGSVLGTVLGFVMVLNGGAVNVPFIGRTVNGIIPSFLIGPALAFVIAMRIRWRRRK